MIFLLIRGNIMDNEENIDDIIKKVRNSGGWGKPGPSKDTEFEIIYKRLTLRCLRPQERGRFISIQSIEVQIN